VLLAVAAIGERAVVPETSTTDAFEEAAQEVDAVPVLRSPAARLHAPDLLDPRPQLVRDRWCRPPWGGLARLVLAAVTTDPSVVERVHEDHSDARCGEARLHLELRRAHVAEGIPLEEPDHDGHPVRVDLEGVRRLHPSPKAEGGVAARIVLLVKLRGVALGDAL